MNAPGSTWIQTARAGALAAVRVWGAFALVEALAGVLVTFLPAHCTDKPLRWTFLFRLLALYLPAGAALGAATAATLSTTVGRRRFWASAPADARRAFNGTLGLLVILGVAAWTQSSLAVQSLTILPVLFLLLAAEVWALRSERWFLRLRFLADRWVVALAVLGVPWIVTQAMFGGDRVVRLSVAGVYLVALTAVAFVIHRALGRKVTASVRHGETAGLTVEIILACAVVTLSAMHERSAAVPYVAKAETPRRSPDVILISLDTVRADHLSVYGYARDTTPNLEQFARGATLYRRAIAPADMTLSTHASIFTGLYPSWHGAHPVADAPPLSLPSRLFTLAERLRAAGYETSQIVANFAMLGPTFNLHQGFGHSIVAAPLCSVSSPAYLWNLVSQGGHLFERVLLPAEDVNAVAFPLLSNAMRGPRPLFMFLNYMDAHWPYRPPQPYDRRYPGKDGSLDLDHYARMSNEVMSGGRHVTAAEAAHLTSQYDGALAYLDAEIGVLLGRLRESADYDRSLVIITSDHGEVFGERGLLGHGLSAYQDQVHVPLIIKFPGQRTGRIVDAFVSSVDLTPTILDVIGAGVPGWMQGRSLARPIPDRVIVTESYPTPELQRVSPRFDRLERAIFTNGFKLIWSTRGKRELFDLSKDPGERQDLAESTPWIASNLLEQVQRWSAAADIAHRQPSTLDDDARDRLKSLGYVR
ncbi:MAG: sulfatase [Acidobacteria bacterium]|nr:sulfatase [Acidobacteriota bacterium]